MTPTGQHIDKPRQGRRLSFSDESGEKLVETAFSDSLHYSQKQGVFLQQQDEGGAKGCCSVS